MQTIIKIILVLDCLYGLLIAFTFFAHGFTGPMSENDSKDYMKGMIAPFIIMLICLVFLK